MAQGLVNLNESNYHLRADSLHPRLPAMIVCVCRRISDKSIAHAARSGMGFDDLQFELGVATQCGKCESCARAVWAQCQPNHAVAAMRLVEPRQQASAESLQLSLG
jgi:bacterioferritin-associated ferredoxin